MVTDRTGTDRSHRPGDDGDAARRQLFVFPHAGGRASIYRQWLPALTEHAELVPISLPPPRRRPTGQSRAGLPALTPLTALAVGLADAVRRRLVPQDSGPVLFGHSLGALLAFETARLLADDPVTRPALLILSAFPSPDRLPAPSARTVRSRFDDGRLAAELDRLGGSADDVLDDPEIREVVLGAFRADLELYESYIYRPGPPLDCPLVLLAGREDTVSPAQLAGWGRLARPPVREHWFQGGHFFVRDLGAQVESVIIDELTRIPRADPARRDGAA